MAKTFFLISQVFYPDEVSTAGLFTSLCEQISAKGYRVKVWCAQPSYNTRERQARRRMHNGIEITYLPSTNFSKNSVLGRLCNYLTFSISLLFKLLFNKNKCTVFTSTNPPYLGFLVAIFTGLRKRKFNYIVQDVFPDGLIKLDKLSGNGIIAKLWKQLNKYTLKKSNKVIIIGRDMQSWVEQTYIKALQKTEYIPIWQDEKLLSPKPFLDNAFVHKHKLEQKFVVQYSGNLGLWNDMESIGKAVNLVDDDVVFTIIGDGMRKNEFLNVVETENKSKILLSPFLPKEEYAIAVTACHVALVSLRKGLEGIAVPSKVIGIMAAGIPVIALVPDNSEIAYIVKENNCGIIVEPDDYKGLARVINMIKVDEARRNTMATNSRTAFEKLFNTEKVAQRYIEIL